MHVEKLIYAFVEDNTSKQHGYFENRTGNQYRFSGKKNYPKNSNNLIY